MSNYILAYYQAIQDGSVNVGRWIKLWYSYIVRGLEKGLFRFEPKKAAKAINFVENYCHHSEGRNDLITLELWQKALLSVIFGILDKNGYRQFREVVIVVARKNGKTLLAAAIIAYMAYLDGEYGAKIYCLAPKLEQANIVYDAFYQMVQAEPELEELAKKRRSDIYLAEYNTSVRPTAFNSRKSDGYNPHCVVCDETSSWAGDAGLKQYEVMRSAFGARKQPLLLSISTAGYVDDGIYDELMKRCTAVLMGNSSETRLAPFLYMIDDIDKWNDINELQKANPNLGVSVSVDYMLEEIAIAEGSLSKRAEHITKNCNLKQNSSQAWLDYQTVDKCCSDPLALEDFSRCYAVAGIDLSRTTDLSSCCVVLQKDGKLYVFSKFFMPRARLETAMAEDGVPYNLLVEQGWLTLSGENHVDYHDCYNWFVSLVQKYKIYVLKIGYDRYCAQYLVDELEDFGFHVDDVYQGENLHPVIQEFTGLIKDGNVCIGANNLLKSHMLNSALKANAETQRTRLVKLGKRTRIDGMAALLDAMCVRQKWWNEIGHKLENVR